MSKIIILDTETTGLNIHKDEFWQLSAITLNPETLLVEDIKNIFVVPKVDFSYQVKNKFGMSLEIAGYKAEGLMIEDYRDTLTELVKDINEGTLVGHNINYDINILNNSLKHIGLSVNPKEVKDTMELYKNILNIPHPKFGIKNPSLDEVQKYVSSKLQFDFYESFDKCYEAGCSRHDARFDTYVTWIAYRYFELVLNK